MKVFSGVLIGSSGNFDEEDGTIFEKVADYLGIPKVTGVDE